MHIDSWKAYGVALQHLSAYFVSAALIAAAIALAAVAAGSVQPDPEGGDEVRPGLRARLRQHWFEVALYCFGFTLFGTITAYFLAQGLTDDGDHISNPLIAGFVSPFVALLTGGVAFVASRTRLMVTRNDVVMGVVCFLLSCVLSYEAMKNAEYYDETVAATLGEITGNLSNEPAALDPLPPSAMEAEAPEPPR